MHNSIPATFLTDLRREYENAVDKHPVFPTPGKEPMSIIIEELGEACQAYNDGDYAHAIQELNQTIVTIRRWQELLTQETSNV